MPGLWRIVLDFREGARILYGDLRTDVAPLLTFTERKVVVDGLKCVMYRTQ